jgi:hypothetical protein
VKEIEMEEVLIGSVARVFLIDNYLIIQDFRSYDKSIHFFDKNTFSYLASTAERGEGPDEIANMGGIGVDEAGRKFYVSDHGKQQIFGYELDSVLANPGYKPEVKIKMNAERFPSGYTYFNDTLCIGRFIEPTGNSNYKPTAGKWNMKTGEIKLMKYEHPKIQEKRMICDASVEHGIYVECYGNHNLMTICTLDGELKYNIYGRNWNDLSIFHYGKVAFCGNRIVAAYSGGDRRTDEYYPTKLLVFTIDGDYIQTLETGYRIFHFCYDTKNNRIILSMKDDIQFGYLDLDEL